MIAREDVFEVLKRVEDPEIGLNVVDLGLVYRVDASDELIEVDFTLTYRGCPAERIIKKDITASLKEAFGPVDTRVSTVWDPPWEPERMSEEARVSLGFPI
ncbi:MAG TPA: metal-sulfur cluster assembly factor [Rectinemataceae bacterium]|nr:metal-sulfur cluster assembly factor [Rectinemataceae bacterium]